MKELERGKLIFVDDLKVAEHLLGGLPGPIKMLDGPVDEDTLESLGLAQADGTMLSRKLKCQVAGSSLDSLGLGWRV
jgi:hypothetical protein